MEEEEEEEEEDVQLYSPSPQLVTISERGWGWAFIINITAKHYIDGHNGYSDYKNNLLQPTYITLEMYYIS